MAGLSTGIVRAIDELGRVVLPIELRRTLGLVHGTPMEIFVTEDTVIFKKYEPGCMFCGSTSKVSHFKGKFICGSCVLEATAPLESNGEVAATKE